MLFFGQQALSKSLKEILSLSCSLCVVCWSGVSVAVIADGNDYWITHFVHEALTADSSVFFFASLVPFFGAVLFNFGANMLWLTWLSFLYGPCAIHLFRISTHKTNSDVVSKNCTIESAASGRKTRAKIRANHTIQRTKHRQEKKINISFRNSSTRSPKLPQTIEYIW